jgi:hypothetical protein
LADEEARPIAIDRNAILATLQRPRILLLLLVAWAIVGVLTEFFTNSGLFMDLHEQEIDGVLGARALSWQGIPLAALYLFAFRNPVRYPGIFVIALIDQVAVIAAAFYHLGAGDFGGESIVLPVAISATLLFLIVLHLFGRHEHEHVSQRA